MALLCISLNLHCYFKGDCPIKFKIKVCYRGDIIEGRVLNIDAIEKKKELEKLISNFSYKVIKEEVEKRGIKFRGMESLAILLLREIEDAYSITIQEGEDEEVSLNREDLNLKHKDDSNE